MRWWSGRSFLCVAWLVLAGAGGCGTTSHVEGESWTIAGARRLPAAEGKVRVRVDRDDNHIVELAFEHLAPAKQAFAGTAMYVLWLVPDGGAPQCVGVIEVDGELHAALTLTTPYEDFDLVVTAEQHGAPRWPSENWAFTTAIRSRAS
jgi:hypothetical protein